MTLNETVESSPAEGSLIPTEPSEMPSGETLTAEVEETPEVEEPKEEPREEPKEAKEDLRFDKHPRFQELLKERKELKGELDQIKQQMEALKPKSPPKTSLLSLTEEQLQERLDENPKALLAEFASELQDQWLDRQRQEEERKAARQAEEDLSTRAERVFGDFANQHPDFMDLWDEGRGPIKQLMDKEPGIHNAISAYHVLTAEAREAEVQKRIDAAVKEAEKKFTANQRAKRGTSLLNTGPGGGPAGADGDLLKDTSKHGGTVNVLVERLKAMRAAR